MPVFQRFSSSRGLVLLFDAGQTVQLCLDDVVLNLFEQQHTLAQLMSLFQQVGATQLIPFEALHAQHATQFLGRERQERLEGDGQVGANLQRQVQDSRNTIHSVRMVRCLWRPARFGEFPRFGLRQIFVADAGQFHRGFQRVTELELVQQMLYFVFHAGKLAQRSFVVLGQLSRCRHFAAEIFLCELHCAVDEIAEHSHQLVVVARLEIFPGKVIIFRLRRIGSQHVAQHILFAGHIIQILVQPDCPVARGRDLVAFQIQELIARHVVRQNIVAVRLEHRREDDAVEDDVVFADEMNQARALIFPPGLPTAQLGVLVA